MIALTVRAEDVSRGGLGVGAAGYCLPSRPVLTAGVEFSTPALLRSLATVFGSAPNGMAWARSDVPAAVICSDRFHTLGPGKPEVQKRGELSGAKILPTEVAERYPASTLPQFDHGGNDQIDALLDLIN